MATKVAVGCGHNQSDQKGHSAKRQADSARLARSAARVAVYTTEKGQTRACTKKEKEDGTRHRCVAQVTTEQRQTQTRLACPSKGMIAAACLSEVDIMTT